MKTFVYKLYRNKKNKYLHNLIDIAGIIYNYCIALYKWYYRVFKKNLNKYKLQKHITKLKKRDKYSFWKLLGSQAIQNIPDRIEKAYKLFFRNLKKGIKTAPPSFKKVKKYKSFTLKQVGFKILDGNKIKIGEKIFKYFKSRDIEGDIKTITIKRDSLGDVYIHIVCDGDFKTKQTTTGKMAGCDFGLKVFLTLSNGIKILSPLFYNKSINEIRKASRNLSSKKKGSSNRKRAVMNLFRKHKKIVNQRKDHHFKLSKELAEEYDYLFFESLNLKAMQKLWGKKISDLGFYSFLRILESQSRKYGCKIRYIDKFYPSSKTCNVCGYINKELSLKDRKWVCYNCKTEHDRDVNASLNILSVGASTVGEEIIRPALAG